MAGEEQVMPQAKGPELEVDPLTRRWSDRMFKGAWAAWVVSLLLPGVYTSKDVWYGWAILLIGSPLAWMAHGWAVYANIFFLHSSDLLRRGRLSKVSLLAMLAFAAASPLFSAIPNPSLGNEVPITSWGWGFPVWLASLVMLSVAAGLRAHWIRPIVAKGTLVLLVAAFALVFYFHQRQRSFANSLDVAQYLPLGAAVARIDLCDLPLTTVQGPLVAPDAVVTMQIDVMLEASNTRPSLHIPEPLSYQDYDGAWVGRRSEFGTIWVRTETRTDRPVLQASALDNGAALRLLESPGGRVLYEQELKHLPMPKSKPRYCPGTDLRDKAPPVLGYDGMLGRALGLMQANPSAPAVGEFTAQSSCNPKWLTRIGKYGTKNLFEWDGRQVISTFNMSGFGYCSDAHAVLVAVRDLNVVQGGTLEVEANVFDRATLRPVANYVSLRSCTTKDACTALSKAVVSRLKVGKQQIVIETSLGEIVVARR